MPHVVSGPQRAQIGKCEAIHHLVWQTKFASRLDMIDVPFAVVAPRHSRQKLRFDVASQLAPVIAEHSEIARIAATYDVTNLALDCVCSALCRITSPPRLGFASFLRMPLRPSLPPLFVIAPRLVAFFAVRCFI